MRLIDADVLKNIHGMKDDCAECDKELRHKSRSCEFDRVYTLMDFCGWIDDAPTIEPEQRWIPCSERLPEEYGEFLVTMTEKAKAEDLGFNLDETYIRKMRYNSNGWQLPRHIPSWINEAVKDEVLAWMPLPEPWKGGEAE